MSKLKIRSLPDDRPIKLTVELPAEVHRDLIVYAELFTQEGGQPITNPTKLIAPMLKRFMATDRAFRASRKTAETKQKSPKL